MSRSKFILLVLVTLLSALKVDGEGVYTITKQTKGKIDISGSMLYIKDTSKQLTINDLLGFSDKINFAPFNLNFLTQQSSDRNPIVFWSKVKMINQSGDLRYFTYSSSGYDHVTVYILGRDKEPIVFKSGDRQLKFAFLRDESFYILPGEEITLLIKYVRPAKPKRVMFQFILEAADSGTTDNSNLFFSSMLIGILLLTLVYTLFLFFSFKQNIFLSFALMQVGVILFLIELNDIIVAKLFFEKAEVYVIFPSVQLGAFLFITQAIKTGVYFPRLHTVIQWIVVFTLAIITGVYLYAGQSDIFNALQDAGFVLWGICIFAIIIKSAINRVPYALVMLFSLAPMLLPILVPMLYGELPSENVLEAGIAVQIITWVAISSSRIKKMQQDFIVTQGELISSLSENAKIITKYNQELEYKVNERTHELTASNEHLHGTLQQLQETQSQLVLAERQKENEVIRSRISQDIHDDVSAELTRISWISELAKSNIAQGKTDDVSLLLGKVADSSRESISKLGEIIWAINPDSDDLESFLSYMRNYTSRYLEDTSFNFNINFPDNGADILLSPELKRTLFLVLKEALHNAVKYSEGTAISMSFILDGRRYTLRVSDNGKGIEESNIQGSGNGLANMKRRMEAIGGEFLIASAPREGTTITFAGEIS